MTTRRRRTTSPARRRTSTSAVRRRRTPTVAAGLGTALGTFLVTSLLDASWPVRIGLGVLVLVGVVAYALWKDRTQVTSPGPPPGPPPGTPPGP